MPTNGHMPGGSEVLLGKREGEALATATRPHCQGAMDLERTDLYVGEWVEGLPAGHRGHFDVPAAEQSFDHHFAQNWTRCGPADATTTIAGRRTHAVAAACCRHAL